jgi:hypothetical protein
MTDIFSSPLVSLQTGKRGRSIVKDCHTAHRRGLRAYNTLLEVILLWNGSDISKRCIVICKLV